MKKEVRWWDAATQQLQVYTFKEYIQQYSNHFQNTTSASILILVMKKKIMQSFMALYLYITLYLGS